MCETRNIEFIIDLAMHIKSKTDRANLRLRHAVAKHETAVHRGRRIVFLSIT